MAWNLSDSELAQNYDNISDPGIVSKVIDLLLTHPDPHEIDESLTTQRIKRVTKIVQNSLDQNALLSAGLHEYPAGAITAAINYCKDGISRIESGRTQHESLQRNEESMLKMHAHFYSHAAGLETRLAINEQSPAKKQELLRSAINDYTECIRIGEEADKEHVAYQFRFRGEAERVLAESLKGKESYELQLKAAEDTLESAIRAEEFDTHHTAFQYTFAGDNYYEAALQATSTELMCAHLASAITCARIGAGKVKQYTIRHWAFTCGNIGKFAEKYFELTGDRAYSRLAREYYSLATKFFKTSQIRGDFSIAKRLESAATNLLNGLPKEKDTKPRRTETKVNRKRSYGKREIETALAELGYRTAY
jgi:hypothetical protein